MQGERPLLPIESFADANGGRQKQALQDLVTDAEIEEFVETLSDNWFRHYHGHSSQRFNSQHLADRLG